MTETTYTSAALFVGKDELVQTIYTRLLEALSTLGPFQEEPKKTSIHLISASFGQARRVVTEKKDAKSGNSVSIWTVVVRPPSGAP
jgi:hypothetical protein